MEHTASTLSGHEHHAVSMDKVIADEPEIRGSHGMQAYKYPAMFAMIRSGRLSPEKLVGKTISIEESLNALADMDRFARTGITVIDKF